MIIVQNMHLILNNKHFLLEFLELAFLFALVSQMVRLAVDGLMRLAARNCIVRNVSIWGLAIAFFVVIGYLS
jgi:hypothetical protein